MGKGGREVHSAGAMCKEYAMEGRQPDVTSQKLTFVMDLLHTGLYLKCFQGTILFNPHTNPISWVVLQIITTMSKTGHLPTMTELVSGRARTIQTAQLPSQQASSPCSLSPGRKDASGPRVQDALPSFL